MATYNPTKSTSPIDKLLQGLLGKDYSVRDFGELTGVNERGMNRAYRRIAVSHLGRPEMVLDVRFLPEFGATKSPAIAVRQTGEVGEAAEIIYGAKAYKVSETRYDIKRPIEAFADLIAAGHEYYERAGSMAVGGRSPTAAFTAVAGSATTGRGGNVLTEIRRKHNIAPASGFVWGEQGESYYSSIAQQIGIAWGTGKRYKEQQYLEESLNRIRVKTQTPVYYDAWHKVLRAVRPEEYRTSFEHGFAEEQIELARMGESGLKTIKQQATVLEAREEVHPVIRQRNEDLNRKTWQRKFLPESEDIFLKDKEQVTPENFGLALGRTGGRWFRQGKEPRLVVSSLITQTPSGAGAAYAAEGALPTTDEYGRPMDFAITLSKAIPLPWKDTQEFIDVSKQLEVQGGKIKSPLQLSRSIGKTAQPNQGVGIKVASVTTINSAGDLVTKPVFTDSRAYETQLDRVTLVVPKFYNKYEHRFSAIIPGNISKEERSAWIESSAYDKEMRTALGQDINIEYSGTDRMFLSVVTSGKVDVAAKLGGSKESWLKTGEKEWDFAIEGGGVARTRLITQEVKSGGDLWLGAFNVQPFENKMLMLRMVDPKLEVKIRKMVESNDLNRQDVTPTVVARVYQGMKKGEQGTRDYWSPRQIVGMAIKDILDQQDPTTRMQNYQRFGIYKITSSDEHIGTEIITEESVKTYKEQYASVNNGVTPEQDGINFERIGNSNMYRVISKVPVGSYILPKVVGMTAEWPMRGGKMPTQAVRKMNVAYPEISNILGLNASAGILGSGDPSSGTRAWTELMQADRLRNESVMGTARRTENTLVINRAMASQIIKELGLRKGDITNGITEEQIDKLRTILSTKLGGGRPDLVYFEGSQSYLPSPDVAKFLDEYEKSQGISSTGVAIRYASAILDALDAESRGIPEPGRDYKRWIRYSENMLEKSHTANKIFSSIETGRAVMRNYNILDKLAANEGAISDAQLEAIARMQPNVRTHEDVKAFVDKVNEMGYLPGFYHRIPSVGGVYAVKLLTAKKVKELYDIDINIDIMSRHGTLWINRWMHESGIGDRDLDKALIWSGLTTKKVDSKLIVEDAITGTDEWQKSMRKSGEDYINDYKRDLGWDLAKQYSHLQAYYKDYHKAIQGGYDIGKTSDFGWVGVGVVNDMAKMWAEIRARRGTSYNTIRFMEEAGAALGIGGAVLNRALGAYGVETVQSSLEAAKAAAFKTPLEANFFSIKKDEVTGEFTISMGLPSKDKVGQVNFDAIWKTGQDAPKEHVIMNSLLTAYASIPSVTNSMIAYLFSSDENMAREIRKTLKARKVGQERITALSNNKQLMERMYSGESVAKIMTTFAMHRATQNNPDGPIDLASELMGTMESGVYKTLRILRSLRTGKGLREFSIDDLVHAWETMPGDSPEKDRIEGMINSMQGGKLIDIPITKEWGGLGREMLRKAFRRGITTMRSSDFGYVAAGIESGNIKDIRKNKILYQKVIGMTAGWVGEIYRLDDNLKMNDMFGDLEEFRSLEKGTMAWERYVAENIKKKFGLRMGGGQGHLEGEVGGVGVRFIPGFLKIEGDSLITTEVTRGGENSLNAAIWKSALNREALLSSVSINENALRKTLQNYKRIHDEARMEKGSNLPDLGKDWVDKAIEIIKKGNIRSRVLTIGNTYEESKLLDVNIGKREVEGMIDAIKLNLQENAPEYMNELELLNKERSIQLGGKLGSLNVAPGFKLLKGIPQSYIRLYSAAKFGMYNASMTEEWLKKQQVRLDKAEEYFKSQGFVEMDANNLPMTDAGDMFTTSTGKVFGKPNPPPLGHDVLDTSKPVASHTRRATPTEVKSGLKPRTEFTELSEEERENANIVGLDFETGSANQKNPPILSMSMRKYRYEKGKLTARGDAESYLIEQPNLTDILNQPINADDDVRKLTGLSEEMWKDPTKHGYKGVISAKQAGEILNKEVKAGDVILGSNPAFDIARADESGAGLTDKDVIEADTKRLATKLGYKYGKRGLPALAEQLGLDIDPSKLHTAEADVELAGRVYNKLLRQQQTQNNLEMGSTTLPVFAYGDKYGKKEQWLYQTMGGNPEDIMERDDLARLQNEKGPAKTGTRVEEKYAKDIAEAQGLYERDASGKILSGPIINVPHEKQVGRYAIGNTGVSVRYAPDILGVDASKKVIQTSMKYSPNQEMANTKIDQDEYYMQEAQYRKALTSAVEEGRGATEKFLDPYIRESSWFKETYGKATKEEQAEVVKRSAGRIYEGVKESGVEVRMSALTGDEDKPTYIGSQSGEVMSEEKISRAEDLLEPTAQAAMDWRNNPQEKDAALKKIHHNIQNRPTDVQERVNKTIAGNPPAPEPTKFSYSTKGFSAEAKKFTTGMVGWIEKNKPATIGEAVAGYRTASGMDETYQPGTEVLKVADAAIKHYSGEGKGSSGVTDTGKELLTDEQKAEAAKLGHQKASNVGSGGNKPPSGKPPTTATPDEPKGSGKGGYDRFAWRYASLASARGFISQAHMQATEFEPLFAQAETAAKNIFSKINFTNEGVKKSLTEAAEEPGSSHITALQLALGRGADDDVSKQVRALLQTDEGMELKRRLEKANEIGSRGGVLDYRTAKDAEKAAAAWRGQKTFDADQAEFLIGRGKEIGENVANVKNLLEQIATIKGGEDIGAEKVAGAEGLLDPKTRGFTPQAVNIMRDVQRQIGTLHTKAEASALSFMENQAKGYRKEGESNIEALKRYMIDPGGLNRIRATEEGKKALGALEDYGAIFKGNRLESQMARAVIGRDLDDILEKTPGIGGFEKPDQQQRAMLREANLASQVLSSKLDLEKKTGPTKTADILLKPEVLERQAKALEKLGERYETTTNAMLKQADVTEDVANVFTDLSTIFNVPKLSEGLGKIEKALSQAEELGANIPDIRKVAAGEMTMPEYIRGAYKTGAEVARFAAEGVQPAQKVAETISSSLKNFTDSQNRLSQKMFAAGAEEAPGWGNVARRALGGFGLMYLRTMFGMTTQGLTTGEKEAVALREQWGKAAGAASGISRPFQTAQERAAVMAGLYGNPNNVFAETFGTLSQVGLGRSIFGAGTAALGAFSMGEWMGGIAHTQGIGQWLTGVTETGARRTSSYGLMGKLGLGAVPGAAWLAAGAVALGGIADVWNATRNTQATAFKNVARETGGSFDIAGLVAEPFMGVEYQRTKQQLQAISGWAGYTPTTLGGGSIANYAVGRNQGLMAAAQSSGVIGSLAQRVSKVTPQAAAVITRAHPEYQEIAGQVAAFAAENNLTYEQVEKILPQWQYGMANPQMAAAIGGVFGRNAYAMLPQMGNVVSMMAGWDLTGQQQAALTQGVQFGQNLNYYGSTLNLSPSQWRRQLESWSQIAGTRMGDIYGQQAQLYMATLGTRGQAPRPYTVEETTINPEYEAYGRKALALERINPYGAPKPIPGMLTLSDSSGFNKWFREQWRAANPNDYNLTDRNRPRVEAAWMDYQRSQQSQWVTSQLGPMPEQYKVTNITTPAQQNAINFATQYNEILSQLYGMQTSGGMRAAAPNYLREEQQLTATEDMVAQAQNRLDVYRMGPGATKERLQGIWSQRGISDVEQTRLLNQLIPEIINYNDQEMRGVRTRTYDYTKITGGAGAMQLQYQTAISDIQASYAAMNLVAPKAPELWSPQVNLGQYLAQQRQAQQAAQWYQTAQAWGGPTAAYQKFGQWYGQAAPAAASYTEQLMNLNPSVMAAAYSGSYIPAGSPYTPQMMQNVFGGYYQGYGGMISGNLLGFTGTTFQGANMPAGAPTGLPWGTTSIALGNLTPMQVAQNVWGGSFGPNGWQPGAPGYGTLTAPQPRTVTQNFGGSAYGPGSATYTYTPSPVSAGANTFPVGYSADIINAFTGTGTPIIAPNGQQLTGIWGAQAKMALNSYNNQMASIGVALQQLQATQAFTTGVGLQQYAGTVNPVTGTPFGFNTGQFSFNVPGVGGYTSQSGGFWGVQEAQMNLGFLQQEQQFRAQQEQMAMQTRQFYQNIGMNMQQAQMQRGWTQQDWAYQTNVRDLQWGWRQQDFQEQARFMTGRDRRLAERQMGRETTLHNLESDQIDKQRSRQKELWKLEDERFELQKEQFEESKDFQQEQLQIAKNFYEARKKLEEESMLLQRAYWVTQQNLQKQSIGIQAAAAAQAYRDQLTYLGLQQAADIAGGAVNLLSEKGLQEVHDQIVEYTVPALDQFISRMRTIANVGNGEGGGDDGGDDGSTTYACDVCGAVFNSLAGLKEHQRQTGHRNSTAAGFNQWVFSQTDFTAGEGALPEKVEVTPLGQGTYRSRWQDDIVVPTLESKLPEKKTYVVPIYIGDKMLKEIIIETIDDEVRIS